MIDVVLGDITKLEVDIIVNAANKSLLGGGGVDGQIHRVAGKELYNECKLLNGCETGEAKITNGYNLLAKKVIHTVGPVYRDGNNNEKELLENCYKNSMILAEEYRKENNLSTVSIAFPCISTGAYNYPKEEASLVAINTIKKINNQNINVIFACFSENDYSLYKKTISN